MKGQRFPFRREALSLKERSWFAGVLVGDGWCGTTIGLRSKDREFAEEFGRLLTLLVGTQVFARREVRSNGRTYWVARTGAKILRQRAHEFQKEVDYASWLRGLFDSEGTATLCRMKVRGYWDRQIVIHSTDSKLLLVAAKRMLRLDIPSVLTSVKKSMTHLGDKPVYRLRVRCSRGNYSRFAKLIGSTIRRKRKILEALPGSYSDQAVYTRLGQARGVVTRLRRKQNGGKY